jgi:hypothetical protein
MENKTLTDQIYAELVDGLKTGLNYTHEIITVSSLW